MVTDHTPIASDTGRVIVYKERSSGVNKGFVIPIFRLEVDNKPQPIPPGSYPKNIAVTRGFDDIDSRYGEGEMFMLRNHHLSDDSSYHMHWSTGENAAPLPVNLLLPILDCPLPPKETSALPEGVTPPAGTFFIRDEDTVYGPVTAIKSDNGSYALEPMVTMVLGFGKHYLGVFSEQKLADCLVQADINGEPHQFIRSIKDLQSLPKDSMDYISDDNLLQTL